MRRGFSLLEIMLALAILGGSLAVLSQIASSGVDAAREARDLAMARIICQAKLSETLLTGITPQTVVGAPVESIDSQSLTTFNYSVEVVPGQMAGLLSVRVTVEAMDENSGTPRVSYSLVRLMVDPALGLESAEAEQQASQASETEGV